MTLIKKVRLGLKEKLTQVQFAEMLGISQSRLSHLEKGNVKLDGGLMTKMIKKGLVSKAEIFKAMENGE